MAGRRWPGLYEDLCQKAATPQRSRGKAGHLKQILILPVLSFPC